MCYTCVQTPTMYWLSGSTCNLTCLNGYGFQSPPNICIKCDVKCIKCYQSQFNCSVCVKSGPNTAYLYISNPNIPYSECVNPCP